MRGLNKFKPILSMCNQGQKRNGVDEGALYMYNTVFRDVCEDKPHAVETGQFNS